MFAVHIYKDAINSHDQITGYHYTTPERSIHLDGTVDNVGIQHTSTVIPHYDADSQEFALATLSNDGKSLDFLPCRPIPLFNRQGLVFSRGEIWVVFKHPSGKQWAYMLSDERYVMFKNDNTGNVWVLNVLKTNPHAKRAEKQSSGYVQLSGVRTFDVEKHDFVTP